ncbi:MAG: hypothetical protein GX945_05910 [Lentisphaerae bacterium]|jgi:transposase-like protein|nr:hypothetical protein [Lentisphaerota bacterium]
MRDYPEYIIEGITVLVRPHVGRRPEPAEVRRALDQMRLGKTATLRDWADRYGIKPGTLRARLRKAGIRPCGMEANRELYAASQILEVVSQIITQPGDEP